MIETTANKTDKRSWIKCQQCGATFLCRVSADGQRAEFPAHGSIIDEDCAAIERWQPVKRGSTS